MNLTHLPVDLERRRSEARMRLAASRIAALPYGNAWWLMGNGVNCVVGELAGLMPGQLARFQSVPR